MRAAVTLAAAVLLGLAAASCNRADDVRSGVEQARSSAESIGAGTRQACRASGDELVKLDELSGALAEDPTQRARLAPELQRTVDRLAAEVGSRAELNPVLAASRDLVKAVGHTNRDAVELAARQAQVAVRGAQALCGLAR